MANTLYAGYGGRHRPHLRAHQADQRGRVGGRPDDQDRRSQRIQRIGSIDLRARVGVQAHVPDIAHHTHYRDPGETFRRRPQLHPFANWIFPGPELARRRLVDQHAGGRVGIVMLVEQAARTQGNAHGRKIVWAGHAILHVIPRPARQVLSLHEQPHADVGSQQRQPAHHTHALNAGNGRQLFPHGAKYRYALRGRFGRLGHLRRNRD